MAEPLTPERESDLRRFADAPMHLLWIEIDRLRRDLDRAHEKLRQGWPKMARDANRSAIEQWNRANAAEAEVKRLRAQVADGLRQHAPADFEPNACVTCLEQWPCSTYEALASDG